MQPPDFQCSWWPDQWFGQSLTECCIAHDLGGVDLDLAACVAGLGDWKFAVLGLVMLIGVKFGRPIYEAWKRLK